MHRESVARLGALDVERAGLRVQERELADDRNQVFPAFYPAREAVLGPELKHRPWPDARDRGGAAERPRVLLYLGPERQYLRITHLSLHATDQCAQNHCGGWDTVPPARAGRLRFRTAAGQ